jgi:hypothetical protein
MCRITRQTDLYKGGLSKLLFFPCLAPRRRWASLQSRLCVGKKRAHIRRESLCGLSKVVQMSSPRPTNDIPQGGEGQKVYPSVSSSDEFTCRSDELQRSIPRVSFALAADQGVLKFA